MDDRWTQCREPWERLIWARQQAEFTTAQAAADSLSMKGGTYRAYERAPDESKSIALDHQAAIRFGRKFKVRWEWLLTGEGTPALDQEELTPPQRRVVAAMEGHSEEEQERIAKAIEALLKTG